MVLYGRGRPSGIRVPHTVGRAELTPPQHDGDGIRYREAVSALDAALPDSVDIVVDAGNTGAAAIHNLPVRRGGRFAVALGMGGMGYSFGAAIGMAFGRTGERGPASRIVVVAGDGSFFMHGMEVHTALHYRLPITFVLFNNNAHAMCVTRERLYYDDLYSYNRFHPSRLGAGLAAMFPGLSASDVDELAQLPSALSQALAADGPSVVSIECSADEIPPFAPFLAARAKSGEQASAPMPTPKENRTDVAARA
jgi:acetolactate synthase-1/2/3 large subunit